MGLRGDDGFEAVKTKQRQALRDPLGRQNSHPQSCRCPMMDFSNGALPGASVGEAMPAPFEDALSREVRGGSGNSPWNQVGAKAEQCDQYNRHKAESAESTGKRGRRWWRQ